MCRAIRRPKPRSGEIFIERCDNKHRAPVGAKYCCRPAEILGEDEIPELLFWELRETIQKYK